MDKEMETEWMIERILARIEYNLKTETDKIRYKSITREDREQILRDMLGDRDNLMEAIRNFIESFSDNPFSALMYYYGYLLNKEQFRDFDIERFLGSQDTFYYTWQFYKDLKRKKLIKGE